jgi:hypothetical protein
MTSLWHSLPARSLALLLLAIFVIFLPAGLLMDVFSLGASPPAQLFALTAFCGFIAVGYFFVSNRQRRLLPLVVVIHIAGAILFTRLPYWRTGQLTGEALRGRLTFDVIAIGLAIAFGYACFMLVFKREGIRYFRAHAEIELAHGIHQLLVPRIEKRIGRFAFCGASLPSGEVGGDLVDLVEADGRWIGYIADVSGHGVASGVLMGMVKSAARMKLLSLAALPAFLDDLNDALVPIRKPGMFVTMACLRYDAESGLEFALAGHPPILHYEAATRAVEERSVAHLPVAMMEGSRFSAAPMPCATGDLFVLITDGLTEVFDADDAQLGLEPLKDTIRRGADLPLTELLDTLVATARAHGQQADDQTVLVVRYS